MKKKAIVTCTVTEGGKSQVEVKFVGNHIWTKGELNAVGHIMLKEQRIVRNELRRVDTIQKQEALEQEKRKAEIKEEKYRKDTVSAMFPRVKKNKLNKESGDDRRK